MTTPSNRPTSHSPGRVETSSTCRPVHFLVWLLLAATLGVGHLQAATTRTWTGGGADVNWNTAGNWDTGALVGGDSVVFNGFTRLSNTNNISNLVLSGISFTSGGFLLGGTTLTNTGGVYDIAGNNTNAIILNLGAAQSITNASASPLVFTGAITNHGYPLMVAADGNVQLIGILGGTNTASTGSLTKEGNGTLRLGAANTFYGGVFVNAGVLQLANGSAIPSGAGRGDLTISGSASLDLNGNSQTINGLYGSGVIDNVTGTGVYTLTLGNNSTNPAGVFSGSIGQSSGTIALNKVNTNVFTLNGSSAHSGVTTISAGTFVMGPNAYLVSTPRINVTPGALFDVSATTFALNSGQTLTAGRTTNDGPTDVKGSLAMGNGSLAIYRAAAAGSLRLDGALDLAGGTVNFDLGSTTAIGGGVNDLVIMNGTLNLGAATMLFNPLAGSFGAGKYLIVSNATANVTGSAASLSTSLPRGLSVAFDDTTTPGSLYATFSGAATPASLVWSGSTGTDWDVKQSQNWRNGASPDFFINLDNVVFNDTGVGAVTMPTGVSPTSTVFNNNATNYVFTGPGGISGGGSFTLNGSARVELNTANSYTGDTIANRGELVLGAYSTGSFVNNIVAYNGVTPAKLVLGGGGVYLPNVANSAYTATFKTLTVNPGGSALAMRGRQSNVGTYSFQFDDFARSVGGTVEFNNIQTRSGSRVGLYFTNLTVINGIMGGWATIGLNNWVVPLNTGTGTFGYSAYQTSTTPSAWGATSNVNLSASTAANVDTTTINSLKLTGPSTVTINAGQTLTLSSGGLLVPNNAAGASTITGGTLLGAAGADLIVHENHATQPLTIDSVIADNGGATALTKSGQGTLILAGNNTYTGPTYISGPSLNGGGATAGTAIPAGTLQIGNGGTSGSINSSSAIINQGTLAFNRSDALVVNQPISGFGGLRVLAGDVTLAGNNTSAGPTTVTSGTLRVGNGGTSGSLGTSASIANNGTVVFNRADNISFAGPISGTGSLTQQGAGSLTLGAANTYQGVTTINAGTLALGTSASISNSPAIVIAAGASFNVSAVSAFTLSGTPVNQALSGNGTVTGSLTTAPGASISPAAVGTVGTLTVANSLTVNGGSLNFDFVGASRDLLVVGGNLNLTVGTVQLNITGGPLANGTYKLIQYSGTLGGSIANLAVGGFSQLGQIAVLSDAVPGEINLVVNSYTGANLAWAGDGVNNFWDVNASANWLIGVTPSVFKQFDDVTFNDSSANTTVNIQAAVTPGSVTVNSGANNYTFQGPGKISNGSPLFKSGGSTLTILTTNDSTGVVQINGGTVQVGDGTAGGSLGTGPVTDNAALVVNQPADTVLGNSISGTGSLTHQGATALTLTADNSYSGGTTISAGALKVGTGGTTGSLGSGPVTNNSTLTISRNGTLPLNNAISGSGALIVDGLGTITIGGANTYLGNTYLSNGVAKLGASEVIPNGDPTSGWLILDGSASVAGTFDLNGHNETVNALAGLGSTVWGKIVNDSGTTNTLTIDGAASTTFAGQILDNSGAGGKVALVKAGASTLTLTPSGLGNTFTGGTIISNGVVSGGSSTTANATMLGAGPVTIADGATLQLAGWTGSTTPDYGVFANPLIIPAGAAATVLGTCRGGGLAPSSVSGPANSTLIFVNRYVRGNLAGNWTGFNGTLVVSNNTASGNTDFRMNTATGFPSARVYLAEGGLGGTYAFNLVAGTPIIPIGELTGAATARIVLNSGSAGGQPALWSVGGLNTSAQYDGTIEDTHGIIKVGTGTWTLSSANLTYTGPTTVSNGVLAFSASSVAPVNSAYAISAPGRLDVTALGVLGVANAIQGNGTLQGGLNVSGTVTPGFAGAPGLLTVTGAASLNGTTLINLNRTNSPNSGRLAAASIVYGGTLTVTNRGNTLVGGETFQLFSGALSGSFTATNLPALAPGLSWNTSSLNTSGTLSVVGQIIPPSIASVGVVGTTNVIRGTGGMPGAAFQLLTSTNVSLPLASWTILGTGTFATDGSWAYTNNAATNDLQFYTAVEVLP